MGQKLSEDHLYPRFEKQVTKLNEDHLLPSKLKRYKRGERWCERAQSALFNQTDDVIDEVYVDICNGVSRTDITQKLINGLYESQKRGMTYRTAQEYYNTALDRMHFNTDVEHQRLKDIFYTRYESLLETAIKKNDVYNAKGILDSMAKIFLVGDMKNTNNAKVEVNTKDSKVTISFGFAKDEEDNEMQEYEEVKDGD
jgi:hypothetical protein